MSITASDCAENRNGQLRSYILIITYVKFLASAYFAFNKEVQLAENKLVNAAMRLFGGILWNRMFVSVC